MSSKVMSAHMLAVVAGDYRATVPQTRDILLGSIAHKFVKSNPNRADLRGRNMIRQNEAGGLQPVISQVKLQEGKQNAEYRIILWEIEQ